MGQKVHPTGFRLGMVHDWKAHWFAEKGRDYTAHLQEDIGLRSLIQTRLRDASVSNVEIDRGASQLTVTIHTARPGIVIGRGGQKVEELRQALERQTGKKVRLNIQEISLPELDARLVARNIADQIERRVSYRRAMKQSVARTLQRGAQGVKVMLAGRLGGSEMKRREKEHAGRVPLQTLRADIDYGVAEAHTTLGRIGVKVWIYRGDKLPTESAREAEPAEPARRNAPAPAAAPAPAVAPAAAEPVAERQPEE